jgi:hypothetical protein
MYDLLPMLPGMQHAERMPVEHHVLLSIVRFVRPHQPMPLACFGALAYGLAVGIKRLPVTLSCAEPRYNSAFKKFTYEFSTTT